MKLNEEQSRIFKKSQCDKCIFDEKCKYQGLMNAGCDHPVFNAHGDKIWCKGFVRILEKMKYQDLGI